MYRYAVSDQAGNVLYRSNDSKLACMLVNNGLSYTVVWGTEDGRRPTTYKLSKYADMNKLQYVIAMHALANL